MKNNVPILILGGGHMGGAMARRWHASAIAPVHVVEHDAARRAEFAALGIHAYARLEEAPVTPAILVLAVKPQQFADLAPLLKMHATSHLLVSIMAGISLSQLQTITPRAVRIMPNLPATIGAGMSVAFAPNLDINDRALITQLFDVLGKTGWVDDESAMHAVTAISGSGPAYVFAFMEALEAAAIAQGLDPVLARTLVLQTTLGAALLASEAKESLAVLRQNVTSPGGTTEAALKQFQGKLEPLVREAALAAATRSKELSA